MVKRWSLDDVKMVRLERRLHERLENKRKNVCVLRRWSLERIWYTGGPRVMLVNKITRRGRSSIKIFENLLCRYIKIRWYKDGACK